MVTNHNTNSQRLGDGKDSGIDVDLVPREVRRNPPYIGWFLIMMRFRQAGKLVALNHASGFEDYLLAGLSCGPRAGFIPCIPHTPCNCDHQFKQLLAYMLDEDEMPNEVHEFPVVYGMDVNG